MFKTKIFSSKKTIATALALGMITNTLGSTSISTPYQVSAKSVSTSSHKKHKNKFTRFIKKHPVLFSVGVAAVGVGAIIGIAALASKLNKEANVNKIPTVLDHMNNAQILAYRDEQIKKFEKMGEGTFEVSEAFINSLPPKVAALVVAEVNEILESYPNVAHALVERKKECNQKFRIRLTYVSETSLGDGTLAMNHLGDIAFNIDYFGSLKKLWSISKSSVQSGSKSPADDVKLAQRTVAHEMGHLIVNTLSFCHVNNYKNYCKRSMENNDKKEATIMKEEIIKIAEEKFGYHGNGHISHYGEKDDDEWIAEVTAHAFCSEKPNALGLAYKEFLQNQEKALSCSGMPLFEGSDQDQSETKFGTELGTPQEPKVA